MDRYQEIVSLRHLFLSDIACSIWPAGDDLWDKLVAENRVDKYYLYVYPQLEKALGIKPESYFYKVCTLILNDLNGDIQPEGKSDLLTQMCCYVQVVRLYKRLHDTYYLNLDEEA